MGGCAMAPYVIAIVLTMVWIFLSGVVGDLADKRGHDGMLWFFFSLFCSPLIGFFVVELLPSADDLMPIGYRPCPHCSRTVKVGREICPYCNTDLAKRGITEKKAA